MPFRLDETRTTVHILTFAEMPSMIYEACEKIGLPSNTRYVQVAVCEKLARDLGVDLDELLAQLPPTRDMSGWRANRTVEEVR